MNGGSLFCLVRREFFNNRKKYGLMIIPAVGSMIIFTLILLSMYYGNIKEFFNYIIGPAQNAADRVEGLAESIRQAEGLFRGGITAAVKYVPLISVCFFVLETAAGSVNDERRLWKYFMRSTPVPMWKYSLANTIMYALMTAAEILVGTLYMALISAVTGTGVTKTDTAVLLTLAALGLLLALIFQTLTRLLHTVDRAGIAFAGIFFVTVIPYSMIRTLSDPSAANDPMEKLAQLTKLPDFLTNTLFPFLPLVIAALLGLVFASDLILLERREK